MGRESSGREAGRAVKNRSAALRRGGRILRAGDRRGCRCREKRAGPSLLEGAQSQRVGRRLVQQEGGTGSAGHQVVYPAEVRVSRLDGGQ